MVRAFLRVERAVIVIKNVGNGLRAVPQNVAILL